MLDKSVPYIDVMMHRRPGAPIAAAALPDGYRFVLFRPGDEAHWARIETSVLEFECEIDALLYFQKTYLPYVRELELRCVFVEDERGRKVATATAWWNYTGLRRDPWLHWVACRPECQGRGIGKAVVSEALRRMLAIEGERDVYLHTQTWSHRAIGLYEKMGFEITCEQGLAGYENAGYAGALALLRQIRAGQGK